VAEADVKKHSETIKKLEEQLKAKAAEFKKAANLPDDAPESQGNGISYVTFTTENQEKAERLVTKLYEKNLIGDSQIIAASYEKLYMDGKKQMVDDHLVRLKMVTADYRVPSLIKYVTDNNPNDKRDMPPALIAVQATDGSEEYAKWIKKQVHPDNEKPKAKDADKDSKPDDSENVQTKVAESVEFHKKFHLVQTSDNA